MRRAVLPWRRRLRPSRFRDLADFGHVVDVPVLGWIFFLVLVIPLAIGLVVTLALAAVELAVEVVVLPFALARRAATHRWPVEVWDGNLLVERHTAPSSEAARDLTHQLAGPAERNP